MTDTNNNKMTIIGLGQAGKNIVENFRGYNQYEVFSVDSEGSPDVKISPQDSHEDYEKEYGRIMDVSTDKIIFILCGSGDISGAALSLLEPYKEKEITIYYIEPDREFLSSAGKKKERIVRNVFMQMTRSAVFNRMFFASNPRIEEIHDGIPIKKYYDQINETISFVLNNYLYFQNTGQIFGNINKPDKICRLSTMGIVDEEGKEEYFYPLQLTKEKEFYFTFEEEKLEKDEDLIGDLKDNMKKKKDGEFQVAISYGVYQSDSRYHICVSNTSVDQSLIEKGEKNERN